MSESTTVDAMADEMKRTEPTAAEVKVLRLRSRMRVLAGLLREPLKDPAYPTHLLRDRMSVVAAELSMTAGT